MAMKVVGETVRPCPSIGGALFQEAKWTGSQRDQQSDRNITRMVRGRIWFQGAGKKTER